MPHDVRRCLDHSLAYAQDASASAVVDERSVFAGHTLNDSSTVHGAVEELSLLYCYS